MADLSLEWRDDFQVDATGDVLTVEGDDETRQRLERRLFTAVNGYVWHSEYGAGLPQKIGDPLVVEQIRSVVLSQIALEDSVAPFPPVQVTVAETIPGLVSIDIKYWSASSGQAVSFTITPTT